MLTPLYPLLSRKPAARMSKRRSVIKGVFVVLMLLGAAGPLSQLFIGALTILDCVLGIATVVTFWVLAFPIVDSYALTRDRVYLLFLVALFLAPIFTGAVSSCVLVDRGPMKFNWEVRMGGEGDPITAQHMLDLATDGVPLVRLGLTLMLFTNLLLLLPFLMMYQRIRAKTPADQAQAAPT
jgi:hypothetical protein